MHNTKPSKIKLKNRFSLSVLGLKIFSGKRGVIKIDSLFFISDMQQVICNTKTYLLFFQTKRILILIEPQLLTTTTTTTHKYEKFT